MLWLWLGSFDHLWRWWGNLSDKRWLLGNFLRTGHLSLNWLWLGERDLLGDLMKNRISSLRLDGWGWIWNRHLLDGLSWKGVYSLDLCWMRCDWWLGLNTCLLILKMSWFDYLRLLVFNKSFPHWFMKGWGFCFNSSSLWILMINIWSEGLLMSEPILSLHSTLNHPLIWDVHRMWFFLNFSNHSPFCIHLVMVMILRNSSLFINRHWISNNFSLPYLLLRAVALNHSMMRLRILLNPS